MWILTDDKLNYARQIFRILPVHKLDKNDSFFEQFGPGNVHSSSDRPFERFSDYEQLLFVLHQDNPQKYQVIHKGVPFYFLAWTAFDMGNYEKALFYMDAAIAEDMRRAPNGWNKTPASQFLLLDNSNGQVASRSFLRLYEAVTKQINRFNTIAGMTNFGIHDFTNNFVTKFIENTPSNRSIITALYTFILEAEDRLLELRLRSIDGGSMEPFLAHLFKGGLIFESLLKYLYPTKDIPLKPKDMGKPVNTLGDIFKETSFKNDFLVKPDTKSASLIDIINSITGNDSLNAFSTSARLRNTTGHKLVWDDVFNDPNNYKTCYEQQINAILYLINTKFL